MPGIKKKSLGEVRELLESRGISTEGLELSWKKSCVNLPAWAVPLELGGRCKGCDKAGDLYLQCKAKAMSGKDFCEKCLNSCETENRPENGIYSERINPETERFPDGWRTENGKAAITWMTHLDKLGLTREDGEDILRSRGIEKIPDSEWIMKEKGRRGRRLSTVSDSSSEGGTRSDETCRFLPVDGTRKSPPGSNAHLGKNGKKLRVAKHKITGSVRKVFVENWTEVANAKFATMYCGGETGKNVGQEAPKKSKKKVDQLAEMQAQLAAMAEENAKLKAAASTPPAPESKVQQLPVPNEDEKKVKKLALKKARTAKKAAELKKKMEEQQKLKKEAEEEAKRQQEALQAQLAALKSAEELSDVEQDDELGDFDSDDEGQEFNPFEYNGVEYHRDDEDNLYTQEGDIWGYVTATGDVVEGERD